MGEQRDLDAVVVARALAVVREAGVGLFESFDAKEWARARRQRGESARSLTRSPAQPVAVTVAAQDKNPEARASVAMAPSRDRRRRLRR
jgi:hypothetical protein